MTRHLLAIRHLDPTALVELIELASVFKTNVIKGHPLPVSPPRTVGLLFFEGSTRTRVSFEQACNYLGFRIVNFASQGSSMSKGETLKDTILTLRHERLEGLVMRHKFSGAPALAARYFGGPVVNAGDGEHEHPTQALGDALTILERKQRLDGLTVAIVGDVRHSRVARSNAWLLHKLGCEVRFVGPRTLMPTQTGLLPGSVFYDMDAGIQGADVVMALRLQKERMTEGTLNSVGEYRRLYQINRSRLKIANKDCLVMHPGPINRGIEVDDQTADSPNSVITHQIENGIFVRMAALHWCFYGALEEKPKKPARKKTEKVKA